MIFKEKMKAMFKISKIPWKDVHKLEQILKTKEAGTYQFTGFVIVTCNRTDISEPIRAVIKSPFICAKYERGLVVSIGSVEKIENTLQKEIMKFIIRFNEGQKK